MQTLGRRDWLIVAVVWVAAIGSTFGQIRVVVTPNGRTGANEGSRSQRAEPFHDAEIENFLNHAQEGIQEKNWKYALDSLQRIIDSPGDSLLSRDEYVYESGRPHAHRMIASLPPEALEVYRLIYDGQAKRLLGEARRRHDERPLLEIVRRFALTSHGDEAADLLTSWMLDEGRAAETISILSTFIELYPDSDIPEAVFYGKLAIAYAMMHQAEMATEALQRVGADGAGWHDRIMAFIQLEKDQTGESVEMPQWTRLMGGLGQNGRMPAVEPEFVSTLFQEHRFPKVRAKKVDWDMLWDYKGGDPLQIPYGVVTDGSQILVKGRGAIFSYEPQTFELLWQIDPPPLSPLEQEIARSQLNVRVQRGVVRPRRPFDPVQAELEALIRDEIAGGIGIAHGIGFHIQRIGADALVGPGGRRVLIQRRNRPGGVGVTAGRNRLVAFDIDPTGAADGDRELWSLGSYEPTDNALDSVAFQSLPAEAGKNLLVVYRDQTSLMAAVLRPEDGTLVQKIGLCQLVSNEIDVFRAMHVTVADSTAYISSEQGLVFAIDLLDYSIRWAGRYPRFTVPSRPQVRRGGRGRTPSLVPVRPSSPPLVVGSLVVLAPADSTEVVALDRTTGKLRWSTRRESEHYLVAADLSQVWLAGGKTVASVDVETGEGRWSKTLGRITGRVALSGDRLYVPLVGDLVALRAKDGHRLHAFELPKPQKPLGNLFCWDGAMYSTDVDGIRKLPDIKRSYRKTLAEYQADPANPGIGLRLAWLELAQKKPKQAINILKGVRLVSAEHKRRERFKAHLTVQAYLQLAGGQVDPAKAVSSLREARSAAQSLEDQLSTQLSLAHRLAESGRLLDAGKELTSLVVSDVGDVVVASGDGLAKSVRSWTKTRLSKLVPQLRPDERKSLVADLAAMLKTAKASNDRALIRQLAEGSPSRGLTQSAWLALAEKTMGRNQVAQSEQYLRLASSLDADRNRTAQALSGLVRLYLSTEVGAYDEAARVLKQMKELYPAQRVMWEGVETTGGAFADEWMRQLPPEWPAQPPSDARPALSGDLSEAWRLSSDRQGVALFVEPSEHDKTGRMPVFVGGRTVRLMDVEKGDTIWSTELSHLHPERWVDLGNEALLRGGIQPTPSILFGQPDGQTLVVYATDGLYGVEMCSGRRLWSQPLGRPTVHFQQAVVRPLDVGRGTIATLTDLNVITVFDTADGAMRWERTVPGRTLTEVVVKGSHVIALDEKWEEVVVFDASTGQLVCFLRFSQPKRSKNKLGLVMYEDRIVGPHDNAVVCFEIPSGKSLWRQAFKRAVTGIFKPEKDRVGVGMVFGHVALLDVATGERVLETRVKPAVKGIDTGIVEGDRLLVTGRREIGGILETCVASVSMSNGIPVWEVVGLNRTTISQADLRAASNVIPVVSLKGDPRARVAGNGRPLAGVTLLDKTTGEETASYELTTSTANDVLIRSLRVYPGMLVIGTNRTVRAYSVLKPAVEGGVN